MTASAGQVAENYRRIQDAIAAAASKAGREPAAVKIIAVSKHQPVEKMQALLDWAAAAGETITFGESYVQELRRKTEQLRGPRKTHLIGALQSNKARDAVGFDMIESIHSPKIARAVAAEAVKAGRRIAVLLQVNISEDPGKSGFRPAELRNFVAEDLPALESLDCRGLMTITRYYEDRESVRPDFAALRDLLTALRGHPGGAALGAEELSMGMSADFDIAIAEGATMVRIGTALFGAR
jgi:PLP dependent protein